MGDIVRKNQLLLVLVAIFAAASAHPAIAAILIGAVVLSQ